MRLLPGCIVLGMSEFDYSIITCCHNSARRLRSYFSSVKRLEVEGISLEFIFVDNASTDTTGVDLKRHAQALQKPWRIIAEPVPGLMHARCAGISAARGKFVIFFDDDNEPAPDFLKQLSRLTHLYSDAVMFTGNSTLPSEYLVSPARQREFPMLVLRCVQGEFLFPLDTLFSPIFPWGAGMIARREAFAEACDAWKLSEHKILGRTGAKLSGGEDVWLAHFLTRSGGLVAFSDTLNIVHRIDRARLKVEYLTRLSFENGAEFFELLDAARQFKPELRGPAPTWGHSVRTFMIRVPCRCVAALFRPSVPSITGAAAALGHAYSIVYRQACGRDSLESVS